MAIILDADVVIRGERGTFELKKWVASRPNEQFEIAAITVAELWHGVESASGTQARALLKRRFTVLADRSLYGADGI
jgi:predicted nucleic acid-binding protein